MDCISDIQEFHRWVVGIHFQVHKYIQILCMWLIISILVAEYK